MHHTTEATRHAVKYDCSKAHISETIEAARKTGALLVQGKIVLLNGAMDIFSYKNYF